MARPNAKVRARRAAEREATGPLTTTVRLGSGIVRQMMVTAIVEGHGGGRLVVGEAHTVPTAGGRR